MVNFPVPVGGTILPIDFAPSIVFAVLYGSLIPLLVFRFVNRRSRNALLIGTACFAIERVVVYSLRASQAKSERRRFTNGLVTYSQVSFALGFISIGNDMIALLRCLLINATYGTDMWDQSPASKTKESDVGPPPEGTEDMKKTRFWVRRCSDLLSLAMLGATIPGIIANSKYSSAMKDQKAADSTWRIRIASTSVALAIIFIVAGACIWGMRRLPRISKRGVATMSGICSLLTIVAIYRLCIMPERVSSLRDDSSLNSTKAKTLLYIFHVLPEWLVVVTLFGLNSRKIFGTGPAGDAEGRDISDEEKEKTRTKKEEKAKKKEEKKEKERGKNGTIPVQQDSAASNA